jgi:ribosomal protein S18 acetylase RimI-like enzyme
MPAPITIRPLDETEDLSWASEALDADLGGRFQALRGELVDILRFPGFVARRNGDPVGLLVYRIVGEDCEMLALVARERRTGVGTALLDHLRIEVGGHCRSIVVVTTNDNLDALRFYQRRGFVLRELRPGAVDESRRTIKPSIARRGDHGIPIRDELELELRLRD